MIMICKGCGKEFVPNTNRQNYCKHYCYQKNYWYKNNKDRLRSKAVRYIRSSRQMVFEYFGGCVCKDCGIIDIDVLTIDHLNNNGQEHRKSFYKYASGSGLYTKFSSILRSGGDIPKEYEVVCRNCNWKRYLKKLRS